MKKLLRIFGVVLVIALCVAAFAAVAMAEGEEPKPMEKYVDMGYEFYEDDDTVPKYKIIHPDGTETIRYITSSQRFVPVVFRIL